MIRPRILAVGAGTLQLPILRAAAQLGQVVACDESSAAPGLALAEHGRVLDTCDVEAVLQLARELCVDAVLGVTSDRALPVVSAVVQALGLPGLAPEVAERCRDKLECIRALSAAGLRVPQTRVVSDEREAAHAVPEVGGFPVIVKPRIGSGGCGVSRVQERAELAAAVARACRAYGPGADGVLVQEAICGRAVGVEAFFIAGVLAEAFVLDAHFAAGFIAPAGHALPSTLDHATQRAIHSAIAAFGHGLGLRDGPANFDLRLVGEQVVLLECNPRLGGNGIGELVRACHGVDLAQAAVLISLGRDPSPSLLRRFTQPHACRLLLRRGHGVARMRVPQAEWPSHPNLRWLELSVSDQAPALHRIDEWTVLGRLLVQGEDSAHAALLCEQVADDTASHIELAGCSSA